MVSVIIPTKNESEDLPRLLASLTSQTVLPGEIIVADARSEDDTREIATSYGAMVVDGGLPGVGRNKGAEAATKDMLLFLDADVELTDAHFLEKTIGEMLERKLDVATCDVFPISDKFIDHALHKAYNLYVRICGSWLPHAPGFCIFVKREVHELIRGFDEGVIFAEDHDYVRRAVKRKKQFGFLKAHVPVSIRRMERDGRFRIILTYILGELHLLTLGPVRHNKFRYSFGHAKKTNNDHV